MCLMRRALLSKPSEVSRHGQAKFQASLSLSSRKTIIFLLPGRHFKARLRQNEVPMRGRKPYPVLIGLLSDIRDSTKRSPHAGTETFVKYRCLRPAVVISTKRSPHAGTETRIRPLLPTLPPTFDKTKSPCGDGNTCIVQAMILHTRCSTKRSPHAGTETLNSQLHRKRVRSSTKRSPHAGTETANCNRLL